MRRRYVPADFPRNIDEVEAVIKERGALLVERQQAQREVQRLQETNEQLIKAGKIAVAERQQAQEAYEIVVETATKAAAERQQAIEALRRALQKVEVGLNRAAAKIIEDALAKLGEQPK